MKEERRLPMTQAGLVRYFDTEEGIKLSPKFVIGIGAGFAAMVILLKILV